MNTKRFMTFKRGAIKMLEMERTYAKAVYKFSDKTKRALRKLGFKISDRKIENGSEIARATIEGIELNIYTPTRDGDRMSFQSINHAFVDRDNVEEALNNLIESSKKLIEICEKLKQI